MSLAEQNRQGTCTHNCKVHSPKHCCRIKAISIVYPECVFVALGILHAMRMLRIILSSVACMTVQYSWHHNRRQYFRKKNFFLQGHGYSQCLKGSVIKLCLFLAQQPPKWARDSSFTRFLDHTQRRTTVGRTPLDDDQLVAETSTWQHTTLTTDKHPCPSGIRTHNLSRRAAADPRLRPRGYWDRPSVSYIIYLFQSIHYEIN